MKFLDIGEVSAKSGIKPSALRYYEEIGLIFSISRHGLRRQFSSEVLLRLTLISMGKEIAAMFDSRGALDLSPSVIHQKADEIDLQIHKLIALRDILRHVGDCPAPSHLQCPSFKRLVEKAAHK